MKMRRPLGKVWEERARAFRKETMPYIQYMAQSGFPGFAMLLLILSMIGYGMLLRDVPPSFPVIAAGTVALTPFISWSPLRTWLQQADTVFLMPREQEMHEYLNRSRRYHFIPGLLAMAAVFALYWPLYIRAADQPKHWLLLVLVLLSMKALNRAGAWEERRVAWSGARRAVRLIRWCASAMMLAAFLGSSLWLAAVFAVMLIALYAAVVRLPARHRFPWERLITEEERTRRRYYRFFSSFIDVPVLPPRIARRSYLSWVAGRVRYRHENTYLLLFVHTLVRTELGGILLRLTLIGGTAVYLASEAILLSGWGAVAIYLLFVFILCVQSGALRQAHRYSVWKHIYPLPDRRHNDSIVRITVAAGTVCGTLLWLPLAWPLMCSGHAVPALAALAMAVVYIRFGLPRRLHRQLKSEAED
ncbi:ABC transporter permease [Paenibacillus tarimensis]